MDPFVNLKAILDTFSYLAEDSIPLCDYREAKAASTDNLRLGDSA